MVPFRRPLLALLCAPVLAQPPAPPNVQAPGTPGSRETLWPAPTADDWKKPVLVQWQRSFDDAIAVARATGKPILACVNMDGEPASEHYAGVRYRQPDIARLYERYVCVIASVYRHNARDYDEHGNRIECPRFQGVTCAEHIALEPFLYERFLDGKRIAPRHIMIEVQTAADQGKAAAPALREHYDVYYAPDTASVFRQITDGVANWPEPRPLSRDLSLEGRVQSRDFADRSAVEDAYRKGDAAARRALLQSALAHADAAPVDLLRLAVFGLDVELARLARQALAQSDSESAIDLIVEALRVPMADDERKALVAALARIGEHSPRAKLLANVHLGLGSRSAAVDVDSWSKAIAGAGSSTSSAATAAADGQALESRIQYAEADGRSRPADPAARLELAEATLAFALQRAGNPVTLDRGPDRRHNRLLYEDAQRAAFAAEKAGATGWRIHALIAVSSWYLEDYEHAYAHAEAAVTGMPADAGDRTALASLLVFAEARQKAIADAVRQKKDWPPQWLTDLNAAYSVLARHPLGSDAHVVAHYDFLLALGAKGQARAVLDAGLQRFPGSWQLHDRLRGRILAEQGVDGLEPGYEAMLQKPDAPADLEWFAAYTSMVAAEYRRRAGAFDPASACYDRAIAHYERVIAANAASKPNADHYIALALAGQARMLLERGDLDAALQRLLASFQRRPEAAGTLDGLNLSPADTSRMLRARLLAQHRDDLVASLDQALQRLDPELLQLPAYERPPAGGPAQGPGRGRRRGG
jgi:tetratricopeptide (TPR) repeat protein